MCKKYVNANVSCYKSISTVDNHILSLNAPLSSLKINKNNKGVDNFVIVTKFNFLGTNNSASQRNNVLFNREKINIIIRLTKCDEDVNKRLGNDIDKFTIDLEQAYNDKQVSVACFDFYDYTRVTNVDCITELPKAGLYVIKVLIKTESEEKYTIQSMSKFLVEN